MPTGDEEAKAAYPRTFGARLCANMAATDIFMGVFLMSLYEVEKARCTRCGTCVRLCVAKIIEPDEEQFPFVASSKERYCIRCGQCVSFCPEACNSLEFQTEELGVVDPGLLPTPEGGETFLRSRRSVRYFKKEGVPRETLKRIFETVRYAPTASNRQGVRWIVLETRKKTEEMELQIVETFRKALTSLSPEPQHSAMMSYIVKRWDAGERVIFRGAPQLAVAVVSATEGMSEDGAIALTYLELAAYALGVGCCWGGFFTHAFRGFPELRKLLEIGEGEHVAGAQMLGFPVVARPRRLPPRKPVDITWFD